MESIGKMKKIKTVKKFWWLGLIVAVLIISTIYLISVNSKRTAQTEEPALQTAKVRTGDLTVSAAGAGSVYSSAQAGLGFRTGGVVSTVNVTPGQEVKQGDVLATLENASQKIAFTQAEANLNALFSPGGIAEYQLDVVNAEIAYNDALGMTYSIGYSIGDEDDLAILRSAVYTAEETVADAEERFLNFEGYPDDDPDKAKALAALATARINLDYAKANLAYYESTPSELDAQTYNADLDIAKTQLSEAQTALELVQSGDTAALEKSLVATDGSALAKLKLVYLDYENARISLDETRLIAPYDGVVVNLDLVPGQVVGTSSVLTLTSMADLLVKFYMDETDLTSVAVGNKTVYTFNAYPESTLEGEVAIVEQSLQTIDGSPVVVVWGSLPERPSFNLLVGMTVDVEVIAGEAKAALLIPVQALKEITPGSYAVFVVQSDGTLKLTPVTIGLRDFANVEILGGLKAGDVVSTGTVETN